MDETVLKDVMAYDEAHYFGIGEGSDAQIVLGGVITTMSESSNPTETTKQYIHEKSSRTNVTGFGNEFPITMDMVKGDKVFKDFYSIFYNRSTGAEAKRDHYIVNLWEQAESEGQPVANTYKARKINQTVSITEATGEAGAQKQINGSLKGGDFVYGTFNTSTKTFTPDA
jgi:hypothetical protein